MKRHRQATSVLRRRLADKRPRLSSQPFIRTRIRDPPAKTMAEARLEPCIEHANRIQPGEANLVIGRSPRFYAKTSRSFLCVDDGPFSS